MDGSRRAGTASRLRAAAMAATVVVVLGACDDQIKRVPIFKTMSWQVSVEAYEPDSTLRTRVPGTMPIDGQRTYDLLSADAALSSPDRRSPCRVGARSRAVRAVLHAVPRSGGRGRRTGGRTQPDPGHPAPQPPQRARPFVFGRLHLGSDHERSGVDAILSADSCTGSLVQSSRMFGSCRPTPRRQVRLHRWMPPLRPGRRLEAAGDRRPTLGHHRPGAGDDRGPDPAGVATRVGGRHRRRGDRIRDHGRQRSAARLDERVVELLVLDRDLDGGRDLRRDSPGRERPLGQAFSTPGGGGRRLSTHLVRALPDPEVGRRAHLPVAGPGGNRAHQPRVAHARRGLPAERDSARTALPVRLCLAFLFDPRGRASGGGRAQWLA